MDTSFSVVRVVGQVTTFLAMRINWKSFFLHSVFV